MKRAIPRTLALLLSGLVIFSATTFAQTFQPQTRLACDKAADHRFRIAHTGHPNQPAVLPFPPEPASFKIKRNLPELRPPKSQNAVKIVPVILPVICDKGNLRADCFFA